MTNVCEGERCPVLKKTVIQVPDVFTGMAVCLSRTVFNCI